MLIPLILISSLPFLAQGTAEEIELGLSPEEEFLFSEEEIVISAAKYEQKISEAPSTIYVITEEDIRQSGLTYIPDILRMIPGLDVITISGSQTEVSARGIASVPSNKILVMIDGRSYYDNGYSIVVWNSLPVPLEEIKQIEVVLGPGSALYGANAFSGVINIITKNHQEAKNLHLTGAFGNQNTYRHYVYHTSLLHGGERNQWSWKVSAGLDENNMWKDYSEHMGMIKLKGELGYELTEDMDIELYSEYSNGTNELFLETGGYSFDNKFSRNTIGLAFNWRQLKFMVDYEKTDMSAKFLEYDDTASLLAPSSSLDQYFEKYFSQDYRSQLCDLQGQYMLDPAEWLKLTIGGSYRYNDLEWGILGDQDPIQESAVFLQSVFAPHDNLSLTVGGRFDHYHIVGDRLSYRASLIYSKVKKHIFRFSLGRAFRNPSYLENFIYMEFEMVSGTTVQLKGDENLEPESIFTYELDYQGNFYKNRLQVRTTGFYNNIYDLIQIRPNPLSLTNINFNGISTLFPTRLNYVNYNQARAVGGEFSLNIQLPAFLTCLKKNQGFINYSFQHLQYTSDDPYTIFSDEKGVQIKSSPMHKANCGLNIMLNNGISANLTGHYVGPTHWTNAIQEMTGISKLNKVDGYFMLNARLAYRFYKEKIEAAITGYNLLYDKHQEYASGDEVGTQLLFSLRVDY